MPLVQRVEKSGKGRKLSFVNFDPSQSCLFVYYTWDTLFSAAYPAMSSASVPPPFVKTPRPKTILVIGGGVAGLAALRALVEEGGTTPDGPFDRVELIERRDNIGGVWYLNEEVVKQEKSYPGGTASHQWPITSLTNGNGASHVNGSTSNHIKEDGNSNGIKTSRPLWPSPAYPALRGNVLPRFLSLGGAPPFPAPSDPNDAFPSLSETQDYLEGIAKPLRNHIRCNIECLDVRELPGRQPDQNRWAVRVRNWNKTGGPYRTEYYDAVISSIGWTDRPLFPRLPGLEEAKAAGLIDHCKWYRGPEVYGQNSRIMIVGNGNSGNDVAAQLAAFRIEGENPPIYRVARHKAWYFYVSLPDPRIKDVPPIQSFTLSADRSKVNVKLEDGSVIAHIDRVIFASGYVIGSFPHTHLLTRQPFKEEIGQLPNVDQEDGDWQVSSSTNSNLWSPLSSAPAGTRFNATDNPERVPNLYWQIIHSRASTLAFCNLPVTSIPFWASDLQSHVIRSIWDGSFTSFPNDLEERCDYERKRIQFLSEYKQQEPERIKVAQEQHAREQEKNKDIYIPPEHTGGPPYHVLGTIVDDYGPPLRSMLISSRPEWETKLPDWSKHTEERNAMYDLKRSILEKRRKMGLQLV